MGSSGRMIALTGALLLAPLMPPGGEGAAALAQALQEPRLVIVNTLPPPRPAELAGASAAVAMQAQPVAAPAPAAAPPVAQPAPAAPAVAQPVAQPAPPPVQIASAAAQPAASAPLDDREVIARANDYFNGITTLTGRFVQSGNNGRLAGTLYVHRPGRVRFAYDEPATIDVIADGRSVVVRDRKLATQDLYPISQTPLKFLLGDRVQLGATIPVIGIERATGETDVILEDRSTLGGTSRITLTFDSQVRDLKQWRIRDAQGFETVVSLSGLDTTSRLDPSLFVINYQPIWGSNTN